MCNCVGQLNEQLKPQNRQLVNILTFTDGKVHSPVVAVQPTDYTIEKKRNQKITYMFVSYCPFCGEKIND